MTHLVIRLFKLASSWALIVSIYVNLHRRFAHALLCSQKVLAYRHLGRHLTSQSVIIWSHLFLSASAVSPLHVTNYSGKWKCNKKTEVSNYLIKSCQKKGILLQIRFNRWQHTILRSPGIHRQNTLPGLVAVPLTVGIKKRRKKTLRGLITWREHLLHRKPQHDNIKWQPRNVSLWGDSLSFFSRHTRVPHTAYML